MVPFAFCVFAWLRTFEDGPFTLSLLWELPFFFRLVILKIKLFALFAHPHPDSHPFIFTLPQVSHTGENM